MKLSKNLPLYIIAAAIVVIVILLIINEYAIYGLIVLGIALLMYAFWRFILRDRENTIIKLSDELDETKSVIEKLAKENNELKHRRLNISELNNIFDLGLLQVKSSFTRTWNKNFTRHDKTFHFIGALEVKIVARYGLDMKKLRVKIDRERSQILVANISPQFLSFNDFDYEWKIAEGLFYKQPWIGSGHWRKSDEMQGLVSEIKEELRTQTHREVKNGPEEMKWILEPLQSQVASTLQVLIGSASMQVKIVDWYDSTFLSIDDFSNGTNMLELPDFDEE